MTSISTKSFGDLCFMSGQFNGIMNLVFTLILFVHQHHHLSLHANGGFLVRLIHLNYDVLGLVVELGHGLHGALEQDTTPPLSTTG